MRIEWYMEMSFTRWKKKLEIYLLQNTVILPALDKIWMCFISLFLWRHLSTKQAWLPIQASYTRWVTPNRSVKQYMELICLNTGGFLQATLDSVSSHPLALHPVMFPVSLRFLGASGSQAHPCFHGQPEKEPTSQSVPVSTEASMFCHKPTFGPNLVA